MKVEWAELALEDLVEVLAFIAADDVAAADHLHARVDHAVGRLARFPRSGRVVPELADLGILGLREVIVPPLRIVYEPQSARIDVLVVFDARRDAERLLLHRLYGR